MLEDFVSRTLDGRDLQAYLQKKLNVRQWPLATWNSAELTLAAFFYSPELDAARARWAVAKGRKEAATERPNPTFGITPAFNSTTGYSAPISPWIVGAVLDIPIETAGKRGYRIAEAQHLSEAARLQIAQTAWKLRQQIREATLDLYAATETAGLLRSRNTIQEDNVKLLEGIFKAGEISANELGQARQSALQREIARQYPDIQIGPGYEFDQSENKWALGLSVTLPVFNQNRGAIAVAEADRAETEARVRVLQAQIVNDLEQAVGDYQTSLRKVKAAEILLEEHKVTADRIRKMYEFGQVVRLEADAAALESNSGALNLLTVRVEAQRALGQIENAMHVAGDLPDWSRQIGFEREDQDHE